MRPRRPASWLHAGSLVCHVALAAAVGAAAIALPTAPLARGLVLAVGWLALGLVTPGLLRRGRNGLVYAALVLVVTIGIAAAETVASGERLSFAALAMLLGLVELALLLALSRAPPAAALNRRMSRASRE